MNRFGLCLAVAFVVMLVTPGGGPIGSRSDPADFFGMAGQMAVVLLLAAAFYAATLFVEYVWTRPRPPKGPNRET